MSMLKEAACCDPSNMLLGPMHCSLSPQKQDFLSAVTAPAHPSSGLQPSEKACGLCLSSKREDLVRDSGDQLAVTIHIVHTASGGPELALAHPLGRESSLLSGVGVVPLVGHDYLSCVGCILEQIVLPADTKPAQQVPCSSGVIGTTGRLLLRWNVMQLCWLREVRVQQTCRCPFGLWRRSRCSP